LIRREEGGLAASKKGGGIYLSCGREEKEERERSLSCRQKKEEGA